MNIGDNVYIPFWVILEYLGVTPPDPFIKCKVLKIYESKTVDTGEPVSVCDLQTENATIDTIPISYLIKPEDLQAWAEKIANWFKEFPAKAST